MDMVLDELAKEQSKMMNELKEAYEKYNRGEIGRKEFEEKLDKNEAFTRYFGKLIADLQKHLNKLSGKGKGTRSN